MNRLRIPALIAAMLAALASSAVIAGCGPSTAASNTQLMVTGSTTLLPMAEQAAKQFEAANPGTSVMVSGIGSTAGIEQLTKGTCDIATSSRNLKSEEASRGLVPVKVARDAIAIIVNPTNPIDSLTTTDVARIFSGEIKYWSQLDPDWKVLGGADDEIGLINRDSASGTREAFAKLVMKSLEFDPTAAVLPGTGQVRSVVAQSKIAIGYISLGFVVSKFTNEKVKALTIDGVAAEERFVADGTYPLKRDLIFVTKGTPEPGSLAQRFIDFVVSSQIQGSGTEGGLVREAGFLPIGSGVK